jgi:membrane associated rhomboid family serine protease
VNQFTSWYYRQPPALRTIVTINVVLYVLAQFLHLWPSGFAFLHDHFALHPVFPDILLEPWQLITYNFLHTGGGLGGLLHIAFNMLWLFWIGKEYEEMHGAHRLWALYLLAGVGGGLMCLLLNPIMPGITGGGQVPVVGASASVLGVLMAVAILYPYKQIGLLFFGVVRLLWVVVGFLIIDALLSLTGGGVAVAAHWGGALSGFLFARAERGGVDVTSWAEPLFGDGGSRPSRRSPRSSSSRSSSTGLMDRLSQWLGGDRSDDPSPGRPRPSADASPSGKTTNGSPSSNEVEEEVDRILDKISEHGYDALSEEEKRTLHEASQS